MAKKRAMNWQSMFADRIIRSERGCLEFSGFRNGAGYGVITAESKRMGAHRLSYMLAVGDIPEGYFVMHKCDNPACVNPEHLNVGLPRDNVHDMEQKGRARRSRGQLNGRAKLKDADVLMIRASSRSCTEMARELGVTTTLVGRIRRGLSWKHLGAGNAS